MTRRVCVFTGTRADYGLLSGVLGELAARPDTEPLLLVSGSHLSPEFGSTATEIEAGGVPIAAKVEMLLSSDTAVGVTTSMGLGLIGFAGALDRLAPHVLVVLGDRYEALAVACAALLARVPIAHLHGGETTLGAVDDALRDALTKLADLHLVAAEPFRNRVVALGEDPSRVFVVGAPGLDHLSRPELLGRQELETALGMGLRSPTFLVTYHPETRDDRDPREPAGALLAALDHFPGASVVITGTNADTGGRGVRALMEDYAARHPWRVQAVSSLGQIRYLSLLRLADVVVGNSSSGIIEAPGAGVPTVNVGDRQRGRLRAASVLDCADDEAAITAAITTALTPEFRSIAAAAGSPYGDGRSAPRIAHLLATADLRSRPVK